MMEPLVSIITPCYNGENYLDRYFRAILAQTYPNLELIFINDGSADRTEEIALSYREALEKKGIHYRYEYQKNAGQATALNRGLKLFTGEYLTWPDADDEMTPDCIEKKVWYLQEHPKFQMVRSDGIYYNEDTREQKNIAAAQDKHPQNIFEKLLLVHTYGCCGCYMITKDLLLKCYPKKDIFESRAGQNWQMLVPAASYSDCGYIDECLYTVYEHSDSHSRHRRTAQEMYRRWDDFTEILHRAIAVSKCNPIQANRMVDENCARQKFYYAVADNDMKMVRQAYCSMRSCGKATLKETMLWIKYGFLVKK